ncbi:hypothetical protein Tco_1560896 [Tanacetum coccineum]
MTKVIKEELEKLGFLKISEDSFSWNTPLRNLCAEFNRLSEIDEDLFTYEVVIPKLASIPCDPKEEDDLDNGDLDIYEPRACYDENDRIYAEAVIFVNKKLVRLMDVTIEQWLDLIYRDYKMVDVKVKNEVVSNWLVRSYKMQFDEYMEIMKQWMKLGSNADMEYDPSNVEFAEWLASKFYNHKTMDQFTKNALWIYWTRGDDEVEFTNKESSDPDDENLIEGNEVAKIFRIETNVFDFETPTCRALKEFNYLLQIDLEVLTKHIDRFKTYDEYKDDWIYEWNEDVPWVHEKPWMDNRVLQEPVLVEHYCEPFSFKSGHSEWPTCSW